MLNLIVIESRCKGTKYLVFLQTFWQLFLVFLQTFPLSLQSNLLHLIYNTRASLSGSRIREQEQGAGSREQGAGSGSREQEQGAGSRIREQGAGSRIREQGSAYLQESAPSRTQGGRAARRAQFLSLFFQIEKKKWFGWY